MAKEANIPTNVITNDLDTTMKQYAIGLQEINANGKRTKPLRTLDICTKDEHESLNGVIDVKDYDKITPPYSKPLIKSVVEGTYTNDKFDKYEYTYKDCTVYFLKEKTAVEKDGLKINKHGFQYNY